MGPPLYGNQETIMTIHVSRGVVRDWLMTATERRELLAMDDRASRDIDLTKADVVYLVNWSSR
jgi:uncharacterized protein YjiS (DUF1127 family)